MGRFGNSWKVFKQSLEVLKHDKELLLLPVFSAIASLIVIASFVFPAYSAGLVDTLVSENVPQAAKEEAQYIAMGIYFNAGIMYAANIRMDGGNPTLGDALRGPSRNLGKIFLWSLFVATISLLMRAIEAALRDRAGPMVAMLFSWIAGAAWWMATYFAIPVVMFEKRHVGPALKRSTQLFKQRWGESLIGEFGLGIALFLLGFLGAVVALSGLALGIGTGLWPVAGVLIVAGIVWIVFVNLALGPALNAIYKTALYRFANAGELVPYFTPDTIQGSWRLKGSQKRQSGWQQV
jgi:hypothetical protein